jgi:large subunit ribosomal protein L25
MAGERIKLEVQPREKLGSRETRRLRKQGLVPGVLYGRSDPHAFTVAERELRRALTSSAGLNAILDVVVGGDSGTTHPSILKEFQQDKVRGNVTHVDFQEVRLDRAIAASVVVTYVGEEDSPGIREGGVLSHVTREINVEALPMEIPEHVELDVSHMEIGDSLRAGEVKLPEGVTLLDDPDETVLATVTLPTREEEPEEEPVEEGAEAAEGAEGEAVAEGGGEPAADAAGESDTSEG